MNSPGFAGGAVREWTRLPRPPVARRRVEEALGQPQWQALRLAAGAPSAHNAQPWAVLARQPRQWVLSLVPERRLTVLDPGDHAALVGIGAFLESLDRAGAALGLRIEVEGYGDSALDPQLVTLGIRHGAAEGDVRPLVERRTPRGPFDRRPLARADLDRLCEGRAMWLWYPAGSAAAERLRELVAGATAALAGRPAIQAELATWLHGRPRFAGDGLGMAELGLPGFGGALARWLLARPAPDLGFLRHVLGQQAARLGRDCGGWLLLCSEPGPVEPLLETGRALQRLLLKARALGVGVHPMNAPLHAPGWRQELERATGVPGFPRVLLRVGYNRRWPSGHRARRPPEEFVRTGY